MVCAQRIPRRTNTVSARAPPTNLKMADEMSTPINTITRENITVLIANNMMNDSVEFYSDCDAMGSNSPVSKRTTLQISKKLFHSPMCDSPNESAFIAKQSERSKKAKKRKQTLIPDSSEKLKKVFVKECDKDGFSPDLRGGVSKRMLVSLFHNKEFSMEFS